MAANNLQYNLELKVDKVDSVLSNLQRIIQNITPKIEIGIGSEIAKGKIAEVKNQILGLENSKIELKVKSDLLESKITKAKSDLLSLQSQETSPSINLKIATAESQIKQFQSQLQSIKNQEVGVDIKTANLNTSIRAIQSGFGNAGAGAGINFASTFGGAVAAGLGKISFSNLLSGVTGAVSNYTSVAQSNLSLAGAIRATNVKQEEQNKILSSSTSTLEQKGLALGFDTKKLYENVSASEQAGNATQGLENALKSQTRAFEDSQKSLNENLKSQEKAVESSQKQVDSKEKEIKAIDRLISQIQKETTEKAKQLGLNLGQNELETEKDRLDVLKNNLQIKQDESKIAGNGVSAKFIQLEIDKISDLQSLNNNKLDSIKFQTEAILKQDDAQIKSLEAQKSGLEIQKEAIVLKKEELQEALKITQELIKNNKITFDADIEPLKRKIEDIRDSYQSLGSGGVTKVLNQELADTIEAASKKQLELAPTLKIDKTKIDGVVNNLLDKFGKTLSKGAITQTISDLLQGGITDVNQLQTISERYVETASRSQVGTKNLGQAVNNLSSDFKNQLSTLSNTSGLAENYSTIVKIGTQKLRENALATGDNATAQRLANGQLTDAEIRQAQYQGTLAFTNDTAGAYKESLDAGLLAQAEFTLEIEKTQQNLGQGLLPAFNNVLKATQPFIAIISDFVLKNPELTVQLAGLAFGLSGLSTVLGVVTAFMGLFNGVSLLTAITIGTFTIPLIGLIGIIAGVVIAIIALSVAFSTNFLDIQDVVKNTFNSIGNFYNSNLKPTIDNIVNAFSNAINKITEYFTNGNISWQEKLGAILGFFITLPLKVSIALLDTVAAITNAFFRIDWGKIGDSFSIGMLNALDYIEQAISRFSITNLFKNLGNGFSDFVAGLLRGIGSGIPGADKLIDPLISSLPRFATGGLVTGKGSGISDSITAKLSNGEFVINAEASKRYRGLLETLNSSRYVKSSSNINNNQDQRVDNSRSQNVNIYTSESSSRSISQRYRFSQA
jgi:hypothetical protein